MAAKTELILPFALKGSTIKTKEEVAKLIEHVKYLTDTHPGLTIASLPGLIGIRSKMTIYNWAKKWPEFQEVLGYIQHQYSLWLEQNIVKAVVDPNTKHQNLALLIYLAKTHLYSDPQQANTRVLVDGVDIEQDNNQSRRITIEVVANDNTDYSQYVTDDE